MREFAVRWGYRVREGRLHVCQMFSKFTWRRKDEMIEKHFSLMSEQCAYHRVLDEY